MFFFCSFAASNQVVLTVQQKPRAMGSPSLHIRALPMPSSTRITGPKPADVCHPSPSLISTALCYSFIYGYL